MSGNVLICDAHLVDFDSPCVERGDLRIRDGVIVERGQELQAGDEEVIDVGGDVVLPGLVNAHMHLYSALAVGMPVPVVSSFEEALERIWWRLDSAMNLDDVRTSAQVGLMGALRAGCTTVIDHHASPNAIAGSLDAIAEEAGDLGVRTCLAYELTDRNGQDGFQAGLVENAEAIDRYRGGFCRALLGLHAGFTLSDASLQKAAEISGPVHVHVAESMGDVEAARRHGDAGPVSRLERFGLLREDSLLAHGIHLDDDEVAKALDAGAWLIHNPDSNRNNRVGYARPGRFGERGLLGTDGLGSDIFSAAKSAFFAAREHVHDVDLLGLIVQNHRLASRLLGLQMGQLREGYVADFVRLRMSGATPLRSENVFGHLFFGFSAVHVEDVWVAGSARLRDRKVTGMDARWIQGRARRTSKLLWEKYLQQGPN